MKPHALIIDGRKIETARHFEVLNPADGSVVGLAPAADTSHVDQAVAAAKAAFQLWRNTSDQARKAACEAIARVVGEHAEELAVLLTKEQGKPLGGLGSRFELGGCQAWAGHTASLDLPVEVAQDDNQKRIEVHRKPIGVVASITPWNWPLMIAIWHIVPAIRTGNTVVIKPSPLTPLSTIRMVEIINKVLPPGVVNVITGDDSVAPALTAHPDIAKVTFTGSTATGKKVMSNAVETLKRLTLELGGNDAGIVLPDVEPKDIAEGLFWGAFINNGQTCAALKRLYVHDDVYDAVCEALVAYARNIPVGNGMDETSVLGPLQNAMQHRKVIDLVEDAKKHGGRVLLGGETPQGPGYFYPLTLVADVDHGTRLVDEEQFGPVLPIIRYSDVETIIEKANDSPMGLGGSVWSRDKEKAKALAMQLECGSAWVNSHGGIQPNAPFGGVKQSGFGVEFAEDGLKEFTTIQTVYC